MQNAPNIVSTVQINNLVRHAKLKLICFKMLKQLIKKLSLHAPKCAMIHKYITDKIFDVHIIIEIKHYLTKKEDLDFNGNIKLVQIIPIKS